MFKRILVPLDGSGRAEQALPVAARIARASGSSVVLVRVVSTEPAQLPSAPGKPNLIQTVGEADRQLAESYLAGLADRIFCVTSLFKHRYLSDSSLPAFFRWQRKSMLI